MNYAAAHKVTLVGLWGFVLFGLTGWPMEGIAHSLDEEDWVGVHMTDDGYYPSDITIGVGTTVLFENISANPRWPAADVHPTHEVYSTFDSGGPVQPLSEWRFIFDTVGEWRWHDHLYPELTGLIRVVGDASVEEPVVEDVDGGKIWPQRLWGWVTSWWRRMVGIKTLIVDQSGVAALSDDAYITLRDRYVDLARYEDPRVSLATLGEEMNRNDQVLRYCHPLLHEIGNTAYERYGDFSQAMSYRSEFCNSGYIHGVIESHFAQSPDVFRSLETTCAGYAEGSYDSWECHHGVGHGVMFYTANDLPRSLEMCEKYTTAFSLGSCANGVFMENFVTDQTAHLSSYLKRDDPLYPCNEVAKIYKRDCYKYAPSYYLTLYNNNYAGAFDLCSGAEPGFVAFCVRGVGSQVMKENITRPNFVRSVCEGAGGGRLDCISGAAELAVFHYGSITEAKMVCDAFGDDGRYCKQVVDSYSSLFKID